MSEAIIPQPDSAVAPAPDQETQAVQEIPRDGLDELGGGNEPSSGESPAAAETQEPNGRAEPLFQAKYDQLVDQIGKALPGRMEQLGWKGDQVVTSLDQFQSVLDHPVQGPLNMQLLRGEDVSLPTKPEDGLEDDYEEPWEKALREFKSELTGTMGGIQSAIQTEQRSRGMQEISNHTAKFLKDYPMSDEEKRLFTDGLDAKIAAMNSASGVQLLTNMDFESFKTLALPVIEPFRDEIASRRKQQQTDAIQARATDAPSGLVSTATAETRRANGPRAKNWTEVLKKARDAVQEGSQR